jgi:hypothetical protein
MNNTELNNRTVCNLRGENNKDDLNALADAIAQSPNIFILNSRLVLLHDGKLVPLSAANLAEFIATNIVTVHLTNRGTPDNPNWQKIFTPFLPPSKAAITTLLRAEKREDGSLTARVPIAHVSG